MQEQYLIQRDNGDPCQVRHDSLKSAKKEARRLRKLTNDSFTIFKSIEQVRPVSVEDKLKRIKEIFILNNLAQRVETMVLIDSILEQIEKEKREEEQWTE